MKVIISGRAAGRWLAAVATVSAFLSLSCVFLYVGGPEKEKVTRTPRREDVEAVIVGTWRWVPGDRFAGAHDYYYTFHSNGDVYGSSEAVEDSTAELATYALSLEPSYCYPGDLAYQIAVDGDFRFTYELIEITKDVLRMADCSNIDGPSTELTFVRVHIEESYEEPPETE